MTSNLKSLDRLPRLRDYEIRAVMVERLREQFPAESNSLIIDEFGCKGSRVDIAVINCRLHGYEIKSECDTLTRLASQAPSYNAIFDRMTVIVSPKHVQGLSHYIPHWWGVVEVSFVRGKVRLRCIRRGQANDSQKAAVLAGLLWRREAYAVLRTRGMAEGLSRSTAAELVQLIAKRLPIKEIADEVRQAIKARGGSGFERLRTQSGDSYTTEPTAADYRKNLDWLLSLQSHHPLR